MSSSGLKIACLTCRWALAYGEPIFSRVREVADISVLEVKCIGGIDPSTIIDIFTRGVNGVLLIGCAPSDCHFIEGGLNAELTVSVLKKLLYLAGLQPERLQLFWALPLSTSEVINAVLSFVEQVKKMGPIPVSDVKILQSLLASKSAVAGYRLRVLVGKKKELTEIGNVYGVKLRQEEFNLLLEDVIRSEFIRHKILLLARAEPLSVKKLAESLNIDPSEALRHVLSLCRKGLMALDHIDGTTPLYRSVGV